MSDYTDRIIEILRGVPEKKLLIIELANQVPLKHGEFDVDALREMQSQVRLAISEATEYGRHTDSAINSITRLQERAEGNRLSPFNERDLEAGLQF